jgi:hypothetical protein
MIPGIETLGGEVRTNGLEVDTLWSPRVGTSLARRVSVTHRFAQPVAFAGESRR